MLRCHGVLILCAGVPTPTVMEFYTRTQLRALHRHQFTLQMSILRHLTACRYCSKDGRLSMSTWKCASCLETRTATYVSASVLCRDLDVPQLLPIRFHPSYWQETPTLICVAKLGEEAHATDAASKGRSQRRWPRNAKVLLGEVEVQLSCRCE